MKNYDDGCKPIPDDDLFCTNEARAHKDYRPSFVPKQPQQAQPAPPPPRQQPQQPPAPGVETVAAAVSTGGAGTDAGANAETSTNSAGMVMREHPIPEDSILADYRDFVREVSELPDGLIVAPVIALCGRLLTPKVTLNFGMSKPLTIFHFMATPAGLRKSTTFVPAEAIAREILTSDEMLAGNASDSALFDSFEIQPHRMQFEDEGNPLLRSWETSCYGREVSARYLKLYDGASWSQNFRREIKNSEDGKAERHIERATLSLCIGATFGVARLDQLESGCGLRRRFGFYVSTEAVREIDWPEGMESEELGRLTGLFQKLTTLEGTVSKSSLTPAARKYWSGLQRRNRERCKSIPGYTKGQEELLSSLNESPVRCLKLAIIFQACRWARGGISDPFIITDDILAIAEAHQNDCLDALVQLEGTRRRGEVDDTSEWLLAQIAGDHHGDFSQKTAAYTKTELTRRFASNPGRIGALTASRLYGEIIPHLIEQERCWQVSKVGKRITYAFRWD